MFKILDSDRTFGDTVTTSTKMIREEMAIVSERMYDPQELDAVIPRIIAGDIENASKISIDDGIGIRTLAERVGYLTRKFPERLRSIVLLGWSFLLNQMRAIVSQLLHDYFSAIASYVNASFDDDYIWRLDMLQKAQVFELFFHTSVSFETTVKNALAVYNLIASPSPVLSEIFGTDIILVKFSNNVYEQLKIYSINTVNSWGMGARGEHFSNMPWEPIRLSKNSYFQSTIPEELKQVLNTALEYCTIDVRKSSIKDSHSNEVLMLNSRVKLGYMKCFQRLTAHLKSVVYREWEENISKEDDTSEWPLWLCSVCNDAFRILTQKLYKVSSNPNLFLPSPKENVLEDEMIGGLKTLHDTCLDILVSSAMETFFDSSKQLLAPAECLRAIRSEISFYQENLSGKDLLDRFLRICADKMVIVFLFWVLNVSQQERNKNLDVCVARVNESLGGAEKVWTDRFTEVDQMLLSATTFRDFRKGLWPRGLPYWMSKMLKLMEAVFVVLKGSGKVDQSELFDAVTKPGLLFKIELDQNAGLEKTRNTGIFNYFKFGKGSKTRTETVESPEHQPSPAFDSLKLSQEENFLWIDSVKGLNLFECNDKLNFIPLKIAIVRFKVDDHSRRLTLKHAVINGKDTWLPDDMTRIRFKLEGKSVGKMLSCKISHPAVMGLQQVTYGKIRVTLAHVDVLDMNSEGKEYPIELFSKANEDNMNNSGNLVIGQPALLLELSIE